MLQIQKKLTPYNRTVMSGKTNKYIVIHYVGAVSTAKNNATYYYNNKLKASAHYFVDEDSIWQAVEDKNMSWHCGGGLQGSKGHTYYKICTNANSIGIEMCCKYANGKWYFEPETERNTAELVRYLMDKYNIPINRVIRHYDVTGKTCPAPYINETEWARFKALIIESEELTMTQYEELKKEIAELKARTGYYNYIDDNMNNSYKPTIKKLVAQGRLQGNEHGELMLTTDMMRILTILDRCGVFD